eukprot:jgi/Bigna1/66708/fgenesh1_pg.2_\
MLKGRFRVNYGGRVKKVKVDFEGEGLLDRFQEYLAEKFRIRGKAIHLEYEDSSGELILIDHDDELKEALAEMKNAGQEIQFVISNKINDTADSISSLCFACAYLPQKETYSDMEEDEAEEKYAADTQRHRHDFEQFFLNLLAVEGSAGGDGYVMARGNNAALLNPVAQHEGADGLESVDAMLLSFPQPVRVRTTRSPKQLLSRKRHAFQLRNMLEEYYWGKRALWESMYPRATEATYAKGMEALSDALARKIVHQRDFVMGFFGSSVVAAQDNCFHYAYPLQLRRTLLPLFEAAGDTTTPTPKPTLAPSKKELPSPKPTLAPSKEAAAALFPTAQPSIWPTYGPAMATNWPTASVSEKIPPVTTPNDERYGKEDAKLIRHQNRIKFWESMRKHLADEAAYKQRWGKGFDMLNTWESERNQTCTAVHKAMANHFPPVYVFPGQQPLERGSPTRGLPFNPELLRGSLLQLAPWACWISTKEIQGGDINSLKKRWPWERKGKALPSDPPRCNKDRMASSDAWKRLCEKKFDNGYDNVKCSIGHYPKWGKGKLMIAICPRKHPKIQHEHPCKRIIVEEYYLRCGVGIS